MDEPIARFVSALAADRIAFPDIGETFIVPDATRSDLP
jgi:hypothetical protein